MDINNTYFYLGSKIDKSFYGKEISENFSQINNIKFIFGVENFTFNFLSKIKFSKFRKENFLLKNSLKYKVDTNLNLIGEFIIESPTLVNEYNIGAEIIHSDKIKIFYNLNEKHQMFIKINSKIYENLEIDFNSRIGFKKNFANTNQVLTPEKYLDFKIVQRVVYLCNLSN